MVHAVRLLRRPRYVAEERQLQAGRELHYTWAETENANPNTFANYTWLNIYTPTTFCPGPACRKSYATPLSPTTSGASQTAATS